MIQKKIIKEKDKLQRERVFDSCGECDIIQNQDKEEKKGAENRDEDEERVNTTIILILNLFIYFLLRS